MKLRCPSVAALVLASLLAPVAGAQTTFTIGGRVVYADSNQTADGIRIELQRFSGETINFQFTRPNGEFEFPRLARGSYYVVVNQFGFENIRTAVEISGTDNRGMMLYLARVGGGQRAATATVSVKQLKLGKKAQEAYRKAMEVRYSKKDLRGSLPLFEEAIAQEPDYFEAHYELGLIYMQLELPNAAESALRKAIAASDQTFPKALAALAALLCDLDRYADAEPLARKSVTLDPGVWRTHYELARALFGLGRTDDAEKSLKDAIDRRADYPDLYLLAANIHMRRNDLPALVKAFDKYLELAPNSPSSGSVREMKSKVEKQISDAKSTTKEGARP